MEDGEDELSRWEMKSCGPSKISLVKVNMWAMVIDELWLVNLIEEINVFMRWNKI